MRWRFTILNNRTSASTIIEEPVGWDKNTAEINRDLNYHGVMFMNQGDNFEFYDEAERILREEYDEFKHQGDMTLIMEEDCGAGYEEFERAKFVFLKYKHYCGSNGCYVKVPLEEIGEVMDFRNRINQKVNLETAVAFDQTTALAPYTKLPFDLTLPGKGIILQDKAEFAESKTTNVSLSEIINVEYDTAPVNWNTGWFQVVPQIEVVKLSEFGKFGAAPAPESNFICSGFYSDDKCPDLYKVRVGDLTGTVDRTLYFQWDNCTPALFNDDNKDNFNTVQSFDFNVSWELQFDTKFARIIFMNKVILIKRKDGTFEELSNVIEFGATGNNASPGGYVTGTYWAPNTTHNVSDSQSFTNISLDKGEYLFVVVCALAQYQNTDATNGEDAFDITGIAGDMQGLTLSKFEDTVSKVFMINETISRVAEVITNDRVRAYSEYFGRTDSQPYSVPADGCGSLEVVTDGIRIRRQENKIPGKTNLFTLSIQDIFDGLCPIHNIGMGLEPDTNRVGYNRLRVEPWTYFYNDNLIMSCIGVEKIERAAYEKEIYSTFQFGYKKWEAEEYNGLDEFLTKRNYRTMLRELKNDLIRLTAWIGSGYAIEVTRRKGNVDTKDWRYDKEVFIVCVKRDSGNIVVEVGNVSSPANIVDPATIYNFRISPIRNALRWMSRVFESYAKFDANTKIIFTDGDGNYFAEGEMIDPDCKLEAGVIAENATIDSTVFAISTNARPFLLPERVIYDYPMNSQEYKLIKADRYGKIYFENDCESGFGYIDTIKYTPEEGIANFNLIPIAVWP